MDILKRNLAPVTAKAWTEIDQQAQTSFKSALSARLFMQTTEPKGLSFAGVSEGRLFVPEKQENMAVKYGIHQIKPLIEARVNFSLNKWELDNVDRGEKDFNLDSLEYAARQLAAFEEKTVYQGLKNAGIDGLRKASAFDPVPYPLDGEKMLKTLSDLVTKFKGAGIEGPYSLVVNPNQWKALFSYVSGYPLHKQVKTIIEGYIILNQTTEDAFLVSQRKGDFELTIGLDFSVGFDHATDKEVNLFLTESFTYRTLEPKAVFVFK